MNAITWTTDMDNKLKDMVEKGSSLMSIAKELGMSEMTASNRLKKFGLMTKAQLKKRQNMEGKRLVSPNKFTDDEIKSLPRIEDIYSFYRGKYKVGDRIRIGRKRYVVIEICPYFIIVRDKYPTTVNYTDLFIEDMKMGRGFAV
jgi:Zn-dependent peptidase ImmA (M78 family)